MRKLIKYGLIVVVLLVLFKCIHFGGNAKPGKHYGGENSLGERMRGYAGGLESNTGYPVNGPYGAW